MIYHGDLFDVLPTLDAESIDACVTDPPYGIGFMGKEWDSFAPGKEAARIVPNGQIDSENPNLKGRTRSPASSPSAVEYDRSLHGQRAFQEWTERWAREVYRVLKPGAHLLVCGAPRSFHRMTCGLEDAGFVVRDCLSWLYGQGFPKSLDVSKSFDKQDAGLERLARARRFQAWLAPRLTAAEVDALTGTQMGCHLTTHPTQPSVPTERIFAPIRARLGDVPAWVEDVVRERTIESDTFKMRPQIGEAEMVDSSRSRLGFSGPIYAAGRPSSTHLVAITDAYTPLAQAWRGWGTALKPAWEPIVLARRPFRGTIAENLARHGTGALNVDASRLDYVDDADLALVHLKNPGKDDAVTSTVYGANRPQQSVNDLGRWPTNALLDETAAEQLDVEAFAGVSRFFYIAKPSRSERDAGCDDLTAKTGGEATDRVDESAGTHSPRAGSGRGGGARNFHPTVKPIALMHWLVRLVTPPGGTVLDPFTGSGTTGVAARHAGVAFVGIEREAEYVAIAERRINDAQQLFYDREHVAHPTPPTDTPSLFEEPE